MIRFQFSLLSLILFIGIVGGEFVAPLHAQVQSSSHAVGRLSTDDVSGDVKRAVIRSLHGEDQEGKDGPLAKIGSELALLYHQHRRNGKTGIKALTEKTNDREKRGEWENRGMSRIHSPVSSNGRYVIVNAIASRSADRLLNDLRRLGLENGARTNALVSGRLPISVLSEAAQLSSLRGMVPSYARVHAGSVGSEADTSHSVYTVRQNLGIDGSGKKICALSDSYNNSNTAATTASDDIQSGDLPGTANPDGYSTPVDTLDDSVAGGDEGRAMLQLIHDLAPGAELGFHTAAGGLGTFVEGIRRFADPNEGNCDVIVDDIGYNIQPFYQDGPVANAVDSVVAEGIPYFSSAGNDGQNTYDAPFRDSGMPGVLSTTSVAHDFNPDSAVDTRQEITIHENGSFGFFTFQWTDPSAVVSGSMGTDTDLDVALVDDTSGIVAMSDLASIQNGIPFESLDFSNDGDIDTDNDGVPDSTFHLVIEKAGGPDPDRVKYVYSGTNFEIKEYDTLGPTIYGHPMADGAMAVAAAPFYNTAAYNQNASPAALEPFSSKGGISIRYDQNGVKLTTPETRNKPDVTGTDGIDNTFFGTDISDTFFNGVDSDPHPNFFGTSAAAPNIAAIGGLILQSRPASSPSDVYDHLESTADDVLTRQNRNGGFDPVPIGEDRWSGHGFVNAEAAVPAPDVSNLRTEADVANGAFTLDWEVRSGADIEEYEIERRYFNGPFGDQIVTDGPPVSIDELGLGAFTFRIRWTRSDGSEGQRSIVDTLGLQEVSANVSTTDEQGRGTVSVTWEVPGHTENFTYRVERQVGTDGVFETLGDTTNTSFHAQRQVPGTYSYRVTARDDQGNSLTSAPLTKDISFDGEAVAIGPYPNPVRDAATLDLTVQEQQSVIVEVYNTIGERLYRNERRLRSRSAATVTLDVRPWSSGVYFLRLRGKEFTKTRKLVVVH